MTDVGFTSLVVPGRIGPMARRYLCDRLSSQSGRVVDVQPDKVTDEQHLDFALGASILGAIAGIASFILSVVERTERASREWDLDRLQEMLNIEAAELSGSTALTITHYRDLKAFLSGECEECMVLGEIHDEEYVFLVSRSGKILTVRTDTDEPLATLPT